MQSEKIIKMVKKKKSKKHRSDVSQVQISLPKIIYEKIFKEELLKKSGHTNMSMLVNNIIYSKLSECRLIDRVVNPRDSIIFDPSLQPLFNFLSKKKQASFKPRISNKWIVPIIKEKLGYDKVPDSIIKILIEWMFVHKYIYEEKLRSLFNTKEDSEELDELFPKKESENK